MKERPYIGENDTNFTNTFFYFQQNPSTAMRCEGVQGRGELFSQTIKIIVRYSKKVNWNTVAVGEYCNSFL